MAVALTQVELHLIERLREQEREEARVIQGVIPSATVASRGNLNLA
jgi:hypothetical protein